jgi:hypothetical protein
VKRAFNEPDFAITITPLPSTEVFPEMHHIYPDERHGYRSLDEVALVGQLKYFLSCLAKFPVQVVESREQMKIRVPTAVEI